MKKVGLTQRVMTIEKYQEKRDGLDQRWSKLLLDLNYSPIPLPNISLDKIHAYLQSLDLSAVILTGGDGIGDAPERDAFELALIKWAISKQIPILGICRGLQMINHYFGGSLTKLQNHVAVRHTVQFINKWQNLPSREVNSYHQWGIMPQHLGTDLQAIAIHADGSIEGMIHPHYKILGIMWHPEREQPTDAEDTILLKEFL